MPRVSLHDYFQTSGGSSAASSSGQQNRSTVPIELDIEPWELDSVWQELVHDLRGFPKVVHCLELCGGASTAALALLHLLGRSKVVCHSYDTDSFLGRFAGDVARFLTRGQYHHFGVHGDILKVPLDQFFSALPDLVVAGPPCPPWAKMGRRKSFDDPRAAVFWRVIEIIIDLATRGRLVAFVIENVEGIAQKPKGQSASPLDVLLAELRSGLRDGWIVEWSVYNTKDFGLPQSRPRVYIVGRFDPDSRGARLGKVPRFAQQVTVGSLLNLEDSASREISCLQERNVADWKKHFEEEMLDSKFRGQYAIVDYTRTPSGRTSWKGSSVIDRCECLTAAGPALHVFAFGCGEGKLPLDRALSISERASLQGFPGRWGT